MPAHQIRSQADLLAWEAPIDQILGRLTLDQKVGQLHQAPLPGDAEHLIASGEMGTALFAASAFAGHQIDRTVTWDGCLKYQRAAMEGIGIPMLFARDVIHGHHTVFPIPLGQAASWNPELVEQSQSVAACEAASEGLHWAFSPVADIGRDPRWGRVAEGYGEDPVLSGELTAAAVRGFQLARFPVLACLKHFAAYGVAEGGRDYARAALGPHELREVYLPSFHQGVKAGAATVMAAFNEMDGVPATANRWLMRDVLKGEFGFEGVIVSDWNAIEELVCHGVAADRRHATKLAMEAGIDIDMVSGCYREHLASLVRDGQVNEELLDHAVRRVLRLKFAMGLFDDPYRQNAVPAPPPKEESLKLSRRFAHESFVLLKNEGNLLPLDKKQSILVAGPFAESQVELFGTWTCDGIAEWVTPIAAAMKEHAEFRLNRMPDSLVEEARTADVVVLLIGEHPMRSGEAHCIADLCLPPGHFELLETLAQTGVRIVTVVFTGRPLALAEVTRLSDALLLGWHPGTCGGQALCDLLFGTANPSGKLPASFPSHSGQVPVHYSQGLTGRPLSPPASRYLDAPGVAQYPFGFGLGYAEFGLGDLQIEQTAEGWTISATVRNNGTAPGSLPVQLYIRDLVAMRARPGRELKKFEKVTLAPGDARTVTFALTAEDLAYSQPGGKWAAEPGEFRVWVATSSADGLEGTLVLR